MMGRTPHKTEREAQSMWGANLPSISWREGFFGIDFLQYRAVSTEWQIFQEAKLDHKPLEVV
jgi:hypothetical protein